MDGQKFAERYEIIDILGSGGMGVVFKVKDTHDPESSFYAIKTINPDAERKYRKKAPRIFEKIRQLLAREARTGYQLGQHPNIVKLILFEEWKGYQYLVFEYVDGRSLHDIQKVANRLTIPQALYYAYFLCEALIYASTPRKSHPAVLHCDFDPRNVLITREGVPKICDWGLSREIEDKMAVSIGGDIIGKSWLLENSSPLSEKQELQFRECNQLDGFNRRKGWGKIMYMPPEQNLNGASYDIRSDIYSYCTTLYRLITGLSPIQSEALEEDEDELVFWLMTQKPGRFIRISERLEEQGLHIPEALIDIIEKGMQRSPDDRWNSFEALRGRLLDAVEEVVCGKISQLPYLTCSTCGFVSEKGVTNCPCCNHKGTFGIWTAKEWRQQFPERPIEVDFDIIPESGFAPLTVHFKQKCKGNIREYDWDFGANDSFSDHQNPIYTYRQPGVYDVELLVVGRDGKIYRQYLKKAVSVSRKKTHTPLIHIKGGQFCKGARLDIVQQLETKYGHRKIKFDNIKSPVESICYLDNFYLSKTPVTNNQYLEFVESTNWKPPCHWGPIDGSPFSEANGDLPVVNITFKDAEAFCEWKGGRLPTADEWEKSARGTDGRAYPWGDGFNSSYCNCKESNTGSVKSVYKHQDGASPYGILDMAGNVDEFVDGGKGSYKRIRGGDFESQCEIFSLAWTNISFVKNGSASPQVGFRVASDTSRFQRLKAPVLCQIPEFADVMMRRIRMGCSDERVEELQKNYRISTSLIELIRERVVRIRPFAISIDQVTNYQYWQFVKETNYHFPDHWFNSPILWKNDLSDNDNAVMNGAPFLIKYFDHPVVHIKQKDAENYCQWLSDKTGTEHRLPTSAEWQAAARGEQANEYPWGNQFKSGLCNGVHTGLARTVSVRAYRRNVSPCGCYQMTGNTSEWTSSDNEKYQIIHGGAFDDNLNISGLTYLPIRTAPDYQDGTIGFRVIKPL